jgi:hypothetical protein
MTQAKKRPPALPSIPSPAWRVSHSTTSSDLVPSSGSGPPKIAARSSRVARAAAGRSSRPSIHAVAAR